VAESQSLRRRVVVVILRYRVGNMRGRKSLPGREQTPPPPPSLNGFAVAVSPCIFKMALFKTTAAGLCRDQRDTATATRVTQRVAESLIVCAYFILFPPVKSSFWWLTREKEHFVFRGAFQLVRLRAIYHTPTSSLRRGTSGREREREKERGSEREPFSARVRVKV